MTAPNDPPAREIPPEADAAPASPDEPRTRIIRRAPTGPLPAISTAKTTQPSRPEPATKIIRRAPLAGAPTDRPSPGTAVAACAVSIVSGWTTSVVATDLITGWWRSDRLFCLAVGFLAVVFGIATVSGVILLLLHRPVGRYLIAIGAAVAVLTYGGVFIAGARVAWIVHTLPVLPIASVLLALHPHTKRWLHE
ncbi:hypothetical protein H7H78_17320 [Mycobacterium shinjukuense]|uniref:Uncharacterized protein n=1 Tax=Mycobacterium shinjukuense TaxID=398694 RepID=A0A7I7ML15_9MYCO|nr:hypothetical protein [Mycobacterium shinjukuense]MCV6987107.1 hypothetical protein [Mycobacterium shinjukuense]ORB65439.1 hypothetical protein BST45_14985 [Mycobacterium shinjukuense]BBX72233.1 hypothetical protein MSHI_01390 [Mycobacterium shinjukuense]